MLHRGLSETARFLSARPPFDALAPEELGEMVEQTEVEFYPAGAVILSEDGGPVTFLRVIHAGAVDLTHDGRLLDLLAAGDTFGHAAMLSGLPPGFEARAAEDTLCYRIPLAVARPLLDRARRRELRVGVYEPGHEPVSKLIRAATVRCAPDDPIQTVARRMTEAGANCAIVEAAGRELGIVTDYDFRTRIVAAGSPLMLPVSTVMTSPVFSVTPDRLGGEVLFEMLERGIHHAPVVSERGQLVGVVEDADLFGVHPRSWFGTRRAIARARTIDELEAVAGRLTEITVDLHESNLRALEVARVLTALVDALTARVLDLTTPSTEGLVWMAVGSQARRELTPASVPRGAVVHTDAPPDGWIDSVAGALRRCGLPGTFRARTAREWAAGDERDEVSLAVLVERRPLWGTPREPLPVLDGSRRDAVLGELAARALEYTPPTGFDADAVLESDGTRADRLDIRRAAVIPIVELGRWAGAAAGLSEGSTPERLRAGAEAGALSDADARSLSDAFELALELRTGHHMRRLAAGVAADDRIEPAEISPLMRDHLRDVFRAVAAVQRRLRG